MASRIPFVAGNWKMNGSRSLVESFANELNRESLSNVEVVVCPPVGYLPNFVAETFSLGAQDVSQHENGAHTGDSSTDMLIELGAKYVIVGHSERREDHAESNTLVAQKARKTLDSGLTPIICVGESLEVREAGEVNQFVGTQLSAVTNEFSAEELSRCIIAYEPVWAIGTGKTASPEQAQDVHQFIRDFLRNVDATMADKVRLLYGGSVKADNAAELFAQQDIDGGLIGGASLKIQDFMAICRAAI